MSFLPTRTETLPKEKDACGQKRGSIKDQRYCTAPLLAHDPPASGVLVLELEGQQSASWLPG